MDRARFDQLAGNLANLGETVTGLLLRPLSGLIGRSGAAFGSFDHHRAAMRIHSNPSA
jgi:hypothetical protein